MASQEWILIVGGSILQWPAVRAARELGYNVALTDYNPACYCADKVEEFIELSTFDVWGHVALARDYDFAAVFTAGADPIVTVARAAEVAGCHGVPVEVAETCADKLQTRRALGKAGVPQPIWACGNNPRWQSTQIGSSSVIVKSLKGSGSRGHTVGTVEQFQDIDFADAAFAKATQWHPYLAQGALVEEWLDGTVLSVETLWYNGVMIPLNAVERPFDGIIELGHYNPLVTDAETYAAIWDVMWQAGSAVGVRGTQGGHILKGDLIITDDGPKVLELTTRLSGGFDSGWTSPLAHGVDYTKGSLILALGRPLEDALQYFTPRWYRHAACMAVFGPKEGGVIKEIKIVPALRLGQIIKTYKPGDRLPPLTDCTQRVAYAITVDCDRFTANSAAGVVANAIEVICE